jgi:hypothetical protein
VLLNRINGSALIFIAGAYSEMATCYSTERKFPTRLSAKEEKPMSWLGKLFGKKGNIIVHRRGVWGEPYCSERCHTKSSEDCGSLYLMNQTGTCWFCGTPVLLASALLGKSGNGLAFPMPGRMGLICTSDRCRTKGEAHAAKIKECCACGKSLLANVKRQETGESSM